MSMHGTVIPDELMMELVKWAQPRLFDIDQQPAEDDTPDERLVRAFVQFRAARERRIATIRQALTAHLPVRCDE
jgi:hypothetical protein